jgi:hypothetical protein
MNKRKTTDYQDILSTEDCVLNAWIFERIWWYKDKDDNGTSFCPDSPYYPVRPTIPHLDRVVSENKYILFPWWRWKSQLITGASYQCNVPTKNCRESFEICS